MDAGGAQEKGFLPGSGYPGRGRSALHFRHSRRRLNEQLGSNRIAGGGLQGFTGTLAEAGEREMRFRAELQAGSDENAVHLDADGADELKLNRCLAGGIEATRDDIASAGHDGSGEKADGAGGVVGAEGDKVQLPSAPDASVQFGSFVHTGCIGRRGAGLQRVFFELRSKDWVLCYRWLMLVGTGIDLIEVPRIARSIERFGERFLRRVFTDAEIAYCRARATAAESFAARFAAKEAGAKALGTGIQHGVSWKELEVRRLPGQRPALHLSGRARSIAGQLGVARVSLSLTHTAALAMATVHLED